MNRKPHADDRLTSSSTTRFFHLLLECQLVENNFSNSFIYIVTTAYLLIQAYSFCAINRMKNLLDDMLFYPYDGLLVVACLTLVGGNLLVQAVLFASAVKGMPRPTLKFVTVVGNCLNIYIAQPYLMMSFSRRISKLFFANENGLQVSGWTGSLCIIGMGFTTCYTALLLSFKCSVPSRALLSKITNLSETLLFLSMNICQLFCAFRDATVDRSRTLDLVFICTSTFFLLLAILLLGWKRVYWSVEYNQYMLTACARLFLLKTASELFVEHFIDIGLISFIILQGFFAKMIDTSSLLYLKIDIFDSEMPMERRYIGAVLMSEYLTQHSLREYRGSESDLCVYYTGLWFNNFSAGRLLARSAQDTRGNKMMNPPISSGNSFNSLLRRSNTFKLVYFLQSKVARQAIYFKLLSLLQATEIMSYFRTSRDLHAMYCDSNGSNLFSNFQAFQLRAIWECRLHALDLGKAKTNEDSAASVLDNLSVVSLIMESANTWKESNYVDTQKTFRSMSKFNKLSQEVENTMKNQLKIFDTLHQETSVTAASFREMNRKTLESRRSVASLIRDLNVNEDAAALYSYFYPTIIVFYSMIQYDVEKSDIYVILYKKKLAMLQTNSSYRREISTNSGKEIDSVAIKVALEKDSLGKISDVSHNANQFLGQLKDSTAIGRSVNILVPESLADSHNKAMDSYQTVSILNKERRVMITDFMGNLKQTDLVIKLAPCIIEPVSAFCLLSFDIREKGPNVILDDSLDIIAADSSFRKVLVGSNLFSGEFSSNLINVGQLSMKLYASIRLLRSLFMYFKKYGKPLADPTTNPTAPIPDKIIALLTVVIEQNVANGMILDIGQGSILSTLFGQTEVHARFEFDTILGKSCIKGYISRKSKAKTTASDGGRANQNNSGENKKQILQPNPSALDHLSDDAATNKAVVEHAQVLAEYNSEQKESMVNKEKTARAIDTESGEQMIHRLEDLIVPAVEGLNAVLQKMSQRMKTTDPDAAQSNLDRSTIEDRSLFDFSPEMREVLVLIDEQQKAVETEAGAAGVRLMLQKSDNFSTTALENGPLFSKTTTYGFDKLLTSKPSGWQQPLAEKFRVVRMKKVATEQKKILGQENRQSQGLTDEEMRRKKDLRMQDPLAWIKQNHANMGGQLKSSLSLTTVDNSNHVLIPNIATHKTIGRIFSLFTVATPYPGERNDHSLLQPREQVSRFFCRNHLERLQKDGAQEVWCPVQQGFEDHQPERYSSLVLLFGCGSFHCIQPARQRILRPVGSHKNSIFGVQQPLEDGPAV